MSTGIKDVDLLRLAGTVLPSPTQANVRYELEEIIGEGAHGVVFLARQRFPNSAAPVVVKLLRPSAVRELAGLAGATIGKEVAALKRLSERVPPTPFVLQFLDTGTLRLRDSTLELPWVATEHVHGGLDGTTLRSRVERSLARSGVAFGIERARNAISCIAAGLSAIHEVGVLHRDVTPGNVLGCGFGETEVFKIADFGLARVSSASTFGNVLLGTPGYCAPEQSFPEEGVILGPPTDVFGMACTVYFLLTGEVYLSAPSIPEMLVAVHRSDRCSVLAARGTCDELRSRRALCFELDRELARATRADPLERQQSAEALAVSLLTLLSSAVGPTAVTSNNARVRAEWLSLERPSPASTLRWNVRCAPNGVGPITSVGWDSDGHFLAATRDGLVYWDGASIREAPFEMPWVPRVVRRSGAGRWLLAGDHGMLLEYSDGKVHGRVSAGDGVQFLAAAGRLDDLVVAGAKHGDAIELWTWINGRFMDPLSVPDVEQILSCVPLTDNSWLFAARDTDGRSLLLEHFPLGHRCRVVARGTSVQACASNLTAGVAVAIGVDGYVATLREGTLQEESLPRGAGDVSAVAVDVLGRTWVAAAQGLWTRDEAWHPVWREPSWTAPFVSILADVGRVAAVTRDGAIVQAVAVPLLQPA